MCWMRGSHFSQRLSSLYKIEYKKINRVPVKITKTSKGFVLHVDGDMLDTFKSQSEAEKTAQTVIKELK